MSAFYETTILQEGMVRITNRRVLIGTVTYSISDIRSVTVMRREKSIWPLGIAAAGLFFILWSVVDQTGYFGPFCTLGGLLVLFGLTVRLLAKPSYVIHIRNAAGESDIFGSTDRALIHRIVGAMDRATAGRITQSGDESHQSVDDLFRRA